MAAADVELIPKVCIKFNAKYHLTGTFHSHTHSHTNTNTKKQKKNQEKHSNCIEKQQRDLFIQRVVFKCTESKHFTVRSTGFFCSIDSI